MLHLVFLLNVSLESHEYNLFFFLRVVQSGYLCVCVCGVWIFLLVQKENPRFSIV